MILTNKSNDKYNKYYYINNNQKNDRLALFFYKKVIFRYFSFNSILDFGCGTGHLLKKIKKQNLNINCFGVDISNYAINKAKEEIHNIEFSDNLNEIKTNSIDLIVSLHVLEHIDNENLKKIFLDFARITHSNSNLLIVVPCVNGLGHILKKKKWIGYKDPTHINLKEFESWVNFFNKNGFVVNKSFSDGLWDFPYFFNIMNFKFYKIFILLIFQILTGKLFLKKFEGESIIFLLKKDV